jgi:hypothetical protein
MSTGKRSYHAKMLGLKIDEIPKDELKDTIVPSQMRMAKDGAFLSLMVGTQPRLHGLRNRPDRIRYR